MKSSEKGGEISAREEPRAGRRETGATGEVGKQETLSSLESRAKSAFQASIVPLAGVSRAASWNPRAFEPLANTRQSRESSQSVCVCARTPKRARSPEATQTPRHPTFAFATVFALPNRVWNLFLLPPKAINVPPLRRK